MPVKKCNGCLEEQKLSNFCIVRKNKDGLNNFCKKCTAEKGKIYSQRNREKGIIRMQQWRLNNPERDRNNWKNYQRENKEKIHTQKMDRQRKLREDPIIRFKDYTSNSIRKALTRKGTRPSKTRDILGCTFQEFRDYIESKFEPWMNWENRGLYNGELNYGWDLDHIIPLSKVKTIEEVIKLNHHTNFQPLCIYTNRYIKKNKLI